MQATLLSISVDDRAVARVTLNRADLHNAFDADLIAELIRALEALSVDDRVRAVVVTGAGKSFSAGADINWMRASARFGAAENRADAERLARLMRTLDQMPKPTLALVNGAAIGGGVGLVACCDIAIAVDRALFALSEVRLGIVPAVIAPFVVRAVGVRQARRLFLTGQRIGAAEAARIGLVHEVVPEIYLEEACDRVVRDLLEGGPNAQREAKALIAAVEHAPVDELTKPTAELIARLRASSEGQEGLSAFLEKRPAAWHPTRG